MSPPPRFTMFIMRDLLLLGQVIVHSKDSQNVIARLPYSTGIKQYLQNCISLALHWTHSLNFPQLPTDFTNQSSHKQCHSFSLT